MSLAFGMLFVPSTLSQSVSIGRRPKGTAWKEKFIREDEIMTFLKSMLEQTGELGPEDRRHLDMANWWVGLGYFKDASDELNKINRLVRAHPDVLCVRWKVYSSAGRWELAAETARALSERTPA